MYMKTNNDFITFTCDWKWSSGKIKYGYHLKRKTFYRDTGYNGWEKESSLSYEYIRDQIEFKDAMRTHKINQYKNRKSA